MTEITAKRIKGLTWLATKPFFIFYGIIIEKKGKLTYPKKIFPFSETLYPLLPPFY